MTPRASKPAVAAKVDRVTLNTYRAKAALVDLEAARTAEDRLAAAKALESAACQLRRALKAAT